MTLTHLLFFTVIALMIGTLRRARLRLFLLLGVSVLAVFALQPDLPIRGLDFWLPLATLALVIISWFLTTPDDARSVKLNYAPLLIIIAVILILGLTRYFNFDLPVPASHPPQFLQIVLALAVCACACFLLVRLPAWRFCIAAAILILLLVILKSPVLSAWVSTVLRSASHQSVELASPLDLKWLGFSYIAFRLIHTLRDRQSGRLPGVSLDEYIIYIIFFPSLTAGPIDRIERFIKDLRDPKPLDHKMLTTAGRRLVLGLIKKFIIADSLAFIALNSNNALQVNQAGWMWFLLYMYSFQLFFDFSGYTDIAIGTGLLVGIQLPENFNSPYLKPNLIQFWNSWHMTLTQWFRAYFFNPLTRTLRTVKWPIPLILILTQLSTMLLIGLWHGVTWNFILWGVWHGVGLFINNRWTEKTKTWMVDFLNTRPKKIAAQIIGVLITFHYVALGWVFFALPDPMTSWRVFLTLFGVYLG